MAGSDTLMGLAVLRQTMFTNRQSSWKLATAMAVLAAVWLVALSARVPEWRDGISLFVAAAEDSPNGFTYANLGHEYNRAEQPERAAHWFVEALRVEPPYQDICPHAIRTPLQMGARSLAWENARLARERGCATTAGFLGLYASAAAQSGDWEAAREATGRVGDDLDSRGLVVAAALAIRDEDDVALDRLEELARADPGALERQARRLLIAAEAP
jgi:tetratricopeptide (TPR) repeat protein